MPKFDPDTEVVTCDDGTTFSLQSELIRGEPRFYYILRRERGNAVAVTDDSYEGSYDKRTALRQMNQCALDWEDGRG